MVLFVQNSLRISLYGPKRSRKTRLYGHWRFEFDVEHCLPPDKWQTSKIVSRELFPRGGFQALDHGIAQQLISKFTSSPKEYYVETPTPISAKETPPIYPPELLQAEQASPSHDELKHRLVEIGQLQGYLADEEYIFDTGRLDVVWRRVERSVPTYVFEVQVGGDVYHALGKLKQTDRNRVKNLLSGTFHEINSRIKFIELHKVEELYKRKKAYLDFEKELGI
jgi:hypothetical protein